MVGWLGRFRQIVVAVSPAVFIFILTLIVSFVTGHPEGLFLTHSARGMMLRFVAVTLILVMPVFVLPRLLALTGGITKNEGLFGQQLVKAGLGADLELGRLAAWLLRPLQGISLSLILAERFLSLLESSIGISYTRLLLSLTLFLMGGALTSIFLSVVWAFDDLGIKIYNSKTAEVRMAGSSIGTFLPLITGAIGVSGLFHASLPLDALMDLIEIVMVLYPPYVFFAVFHHELVVRRRLALSGIFQLRKVETMVR